MVFLMTMQQILRILSYPLLPFCVQHVQKINLALVATSVVSVTTVQHVMLQLAGVHVRLAGLVPDVVDRVLTVTMATTARYHATAITMLAVITSPVHVTAQLASLENFVKKVS